MTMHDSLMTDKQAAALAAVICRAMDYLALRASPIPSLASQYVAAEASVAAAIKNLPNDN